MPGGFDVNYMSALNVRIDAHADYAIADYSALRVGGSNQDDQYVTLRPGLTYLPTANFSGSVQNLSHFGPVARPG